MRAEDKLIVALDAPSLRDAEKIVKSLKGAVKIFKVGKELFTAAGPEAVNMVHGYGAKVFLDLKFHDIPNTVAGACKSAASMGVFMMNVHASGGHKMMTQASEALHQFANEKQIVKPLLIGVTVLTSFDENDLNEIGIRSTTENQVKHLAILAKQSRLDGVVASPKEIEVIRKNTDKDFLIVTPGVRPSWSETGDQKRIMTPKEAVELGANFLVIGRPITAHDNPPLAANKILKEMES